MISGHFQIHFQEDDHWVLGNKNGMISSAITIATKYTCEDNKNRHSSTFFWYVDEISLARIVTTDAF